MVSNLNRLPDGVPGGFSVSLGCSTAKGTSCQPRLLSQSLGAGRAPIKAAEPRLAWCRRLPPHATELQRCEPRLSPPRRAALIRHGAAQKRSTAPPSPRGRQGRLPPQSADIAAVRAAGGAKAVFPKGKGFSPHKFAVFVAPGRVFCYNTFNNTQNAQKGLFV